jgi:hypothetical protein
MKDIFNPDYQVVQGKLQCPNCGSEISVKGILENSTIAWPNQNWILFKCPVCINYSHAEVKTGKITTGKLDGAPGPAFFPDSEIKIKNFMVKKTLEKIDCKFEGITYIFKAKN